MMLNVEAVGYSEYKITWWIDKQYWLYTVGREALHKGGEAVRDALAVVSRVAHGGDRETRRTALLALASAGRNLRYRLFNDPQKKANIRSLEACIEQERMRNRELVIHAELSIGVPWGLIFDGDVPSVDSGKKEIEEFSGFWCMRYRLSATTGDNARALDKWQRPRKTFGMLSLVNRAVKEKFAEDLPPEMYRELCEMLDPPVGEPENLEHCQQLMGETQQLDLIVHFLGHHENQVLILADDYQISFDDFSRMLDWLTDRSEFDSSQPCGLVFLNGCDSAVGEKDLNLRWHTSRPQICGVIATEALVRRKFAVLFGFYFLKAMVKEGKTVAQAMDELHNDEKLWPESLMYGCYAHPDYCIESPVALIKPPASSGESQEVVLQTR
jgi:uncharacterized protein YuzB (UPF0349 family)